MLNKVPTKGKMFLLYKWYPCLKGNFFGTEVSKIINRPPFFNTRSISERPFSKFSKFRTPKDTVITSKLLSSKGIASPSPLIKSTFACKTVLFTFLRAIESMPSERSKPMIVFAAMCLANSMAKSPVPVATSSMLSGLWFFAICSTLRRHFKSVPKEMTLLRLSYLFDMVSNICSTCSFLLSVESL